MEKTTLNKANELDKKIREFNQALECFEWSYPGEEKPSSDENYLKHSTNPRLIIDFDGPDGREQQTIPMVLSDTLITILKNTIEELRDKTIKEFKNL